MIRSLILAFALVATFTLGLGSKAEAAVWTEVNQWSPTWEARFAEWVRSSWQVDFFSRPVLPNGQSNPYAGLRLDCADTVYSMRLIFAYENRLPFVIQDPTASGKTLSNKMSRWDGQSETSRVRNFLVFMFQTVSTRSLPNDTYPVAVNRDAIHSGSLILTVAKNHHSWTIKEILSIGVPHLVYNSTVGASSGSGLQQRQSWPNPEWVFEENFTAAGNAGFRYWRPTEYLNQPVWKTPGYSEEQYKIPLGKWVRTVQSKLALRQETDTQMMTRMLNTTCEDLTGRVTAVNDGLNYLKKNPKCMDYATYDTYSTPNRDQRAFDDFVALRRAYREILAANGGNQLSAEMKAQLGKIYPMIQSSIAAETQNMAPQGITSASLCTTEYLPGKRMDVAEFKRRLSAGLISNNPHDEGSYRWGDLRGPSQRAKSCQSWDSWTPDLNQN
ncbi:hypothetical protein [Bdellovibrio svalbardensis]|uniref:Uncharacterized protein n=1 Tax=Bdellovibrio svalbardensis TaxID=2972972 RepID=A0ABT6DG96_9BACT|nr:hypothetical protein [Bdellovibrio svalbardensis]MDG0815865.1 hypothetical protein [Bdellovibrio svalbardensis]